jgi:hypothetical protein
MNHILDYPIAIFALSLLLLWGSAFVGSFLQQELGPIDEHQLRDFNVVQGAALTLLSLLIGFTFSMAITRYDQRKNYEEEEANAIGTEYVRADLLPTKDSARIRELLRNYLDQRVLFYSTRDLQQLRQIAATTSQLQNELWSVIEASAENRPTAPVALAASGMNDVLNSQGYTQAAWWNRIPIAAWVLLIAIAIGCNLLTGYGAYRTSIRLFMVLPLAVSVSFFLIADIDSPRGGVIRVQPRNLLSLSQTIHRR